MGILREWVSRLIDTMRARRQDRDLEEELKCHVELAAEHARRFGENETEALRTARLRAGGIPQAMEALRDQRGWPIVAGTLQDVRVVVRSLQKTPVVSSIAILSLALAIGATTAIFSIVNGLLLRTLPVHDPGRLVHVSDSVVTDTGETRVRSWSYPAWEQIRQRPHLFEAATAWAFTRFNLASGGETQFVDGLWVDGGFFDALGVTTIAGRPLSALDDQPGGGPDGPTAVISYGYWQRQFAGDADAIGRSMRLNNVPFTIVGVTPPSFFGVEVGRTFDVIVPLRTEALVRRRDSVLESASTNFLSIIARLKREQTLEAATAALRSAQVGIREATLGAWDVAVSDQYLTSPMTLIPASTGFSNLRRNYERPLYFLVTVVALVLLIGCINVANLLLARAIARRHELSVQVALGASRWRLVRQHLTESLVLATSSAALAVAIAAYGGDFVVQQLSTPTNVVFLDLSIDTRVLVFTFAVAAFTAMLFGTMPAFRATRVRPIDALREQGRSNTQNRNGLMGSLVALQVALSVVLLVAAGLFIRSFTSLAMRNLGVDADRVLVVSVDPVPTGIDPSRRAALYEEARAAVAQLPNVAAAAVSYRTPVGGGGFTPAIEIASDREPNHVPANGDVFGNLISPGWFGTFGTPFIAGRDFTENDRQGAPPVGVVNETFARRFFGGGSAIGRVVTIYPNTPRALRVEIVGVVGDAVYNVPREPVPPTWYVPIAQFNVPGFSIAPGRLSVRAGTGAPESLTKSVAAAIVAIHPQLALTFRPLADQIHSALTRERLLAQLAGFFGLIGLLLAGLGLYGVTAYAVSTRRPEIGIRLALGASSTRVVATVLARVAVMVIVGIAAGAVVSLWGSKFISSLIFGLPPQDLATLLGGSLVLAVVGAVAGWLPARRAVCASPADALREN